MSRIKQVTIKTTAQAAADAVQTEYDNISSDVSDKELIAAREEAASAALIVSEKETSLKSAKLAEINAYDEEYVEPVLDAWLADTEDSSAEATNIVPSGSASSNAASENKVEGTDFQVPESDRKNPITGDRNNLPLYSAMACTSVFVGLFGIFLRKKACGKK